MKITISCSGGTMRTIHLARRLDRRGFLDTLYVPHYLPLMRSIRESSDGRIEPAHLRSSLFAAVFQKAIELARIDKLSKIEKRYFFAEALDRDVARRIRPGSDIVVAESNIALHTLRKAKSLGAIAIIDRTNSHIEYQTRILEEEYARLGIRHVFNCRQIVEKGVCEYEEADYICVLSSFVKSTFIDYGVPADKLLLIPSGVSLSTFHQVGKEDNVFRIIFCGLASIKKGVHYLLEAFDELKLKNAELWFIGGILGDVRPIMSQYAHIFKHWGFVPQNELHKFFSQGSVFVLPSLEEGMAKVIMEAMACGLPVIATTNTGAEDIYDDNAHGFIIPVRDKEALKEKLLFCYEQPDICREMGQQAITKVHSSLSWDAYAERVEQVFSEFINVREAC